jgi:hypothetical protein
MRDVIPDEPNITTPLLRKDCQPAKQSHARDSTMIIQLHASDAVPHTYEKTQFCANIDQGLARTSMTFEKLPLAVAGKL